MDCLRRAFQYVSGSSVNSTMELVSMHDIDERNAREKGFDGAVFCGRQISVLAANEGCFESLIVLQDRDGRKVEKLRFNERHPLVKKTISLEHSSMIEAEVGAMLRIIHNPHQNIITCYGGVRTDKSYNLYFNFGGECFLSALSRYKFTAASFNNITKQTIAMLEFLYMNGIKHGDFDFQNMVYDQSTDTLKLIDFGSSVICDDKTSSTCLSDDDKNILTEYIVSQSICDEVELGQPDNTKKTKITYFSPLKDIYDNGCHLTLLQARHDVDFGNWNSVISKCTLPESIEFLMHDNQMWNRALPKDTQSILCLCLKNTPGYHNIIFRAASDISPITRIFENT